MTLKEFSAEYLPLPNAYKNSSPDFRWRKVFPTELRTIDREVTVRQAGFWSGKLTVNVPVLQERWERIHGGEVIDSEWRPVYAY